VDVHLAWRAQCCKIAGGEVFLGTAPGASFRAAAALLANHGVEIAPRLGRLVMDFGLVISLDGIFGPRAPLIGSLELEGEGICDGYHPAMLTVSLSHELGEEYLRFLPQYSESAGDLEVGFVAVVGVEEPAARQVLSRVRQAGTVRMTELPKLVLAAQTAGA
jgi:hypothetical protein